MANTIKSEQAAEYAASKHHPEIVFTNQTPTQTDDDVIHAAIHILENRLKTSGEAMDSPSTVSDYLRLKLATYEYEVFAVLFLDNRHRVIAFEELFRGTIDGASVYPREVVREAIKHNAAAIICAHNHPSGIAEPSNADILITSRLKEALALIDVRVLDHIIVGSHTTTSLAERGQV